MTAEVRGCCFHTRKEKSAVVRSVAPHVWYWVGDDFTLRLPEDLDARLARAVNGHRPAGRRGGGRGWARRVRQDDGVLRTLVGFGDGGQSALRDRLRGLAVSLRGREV